MPLSDGFYEALGCEVIHFPHQEFILCALPSIYNPHDLLHLHYPQFFTAPTIARRETIYMHGTHFARTVAVASQRIKDDLVQHYRLAPEKIQVIPWGVPTRAFAEASPADLVTVKDKYRLEQPFAFFPARPWPHKNHLRLFEALASLRGSLGLTVQLVCTGSRYEPFWPQIESSLQRLKLEPQVLGWIYALSTGYRISLLCQRFSSPTAFPFMRPG